MNDTATDTAADELFTRGGSAQPVTVAPGGQTASPTPANIVFVPLSEPRQIIKFTSATVAAPHNQESNKQPVRAPYSGVFSARIAKVKRVTADIFSQLRDLKFTDG